MDQAISSNPSDLVSIFSASVVVITAAFILFVSGSAIFRMGPKTNHLIRLVYTTAATGAFAQLVGVVHLGMQATLIDVVITMSIGVLLALLDRRSHIGPHPNMPHQDRRRGVHG